MKKFAILGLIIFLLSFIVGSATGATSAVTNQSLAVKTSGGVKQVKAIFVNLTDWEVRPVLAKNTVGATESLASMVTRSGAVAGINGTFFNSYSDMQPHGNLQIESKLVHTGTTGTTMGLTLDNKVLFARLYVGIEGSINDSYEWPNNWYAWGINQVNADPSAIIIFTPAKGKTTGTTKATSIVVKAGVVTAIRSGVVSIPADGFVITANSGKAAQQVAARFKVGDRVSYRFNYKQGSKTGPALNWEQVRHALGAGPRLLTAGKVSVNFQLEGMQDPKLTTYRSLRSFIGVDKQGKLVMGTVAGATVRELAEVVQKMGLVEAMNLDGGASSGLVYSGKYLTTPGRLLSNSLVVVKRTTPVVQPPSPNEQAYKYYLDGKSLEQKGDLSGAKAKFLAALELNKNLTDAYLKLAVIYHQEKLYEQAVNYFEEAIRLNPKNPAPYEKIAWIYYGQYQYLEARSAFQRLAQADAASRAKAFYGIGLTYSAWQVKEYQLAREYFQQAITADPSGTYAQLAREQLAKLPS